jgi:O-antigen/teichoic acid export membrane protein
MIVLHKLSVIPLRLSTVWLFWTLGNLCAIALLLTHIRRADLTNFLHEPTQWRNLLLGLRTSVKYVVVFLSFLFSSYCGRYFLLLYVDSAAAGVFFFVSSVTNIIYTMIETGLLNIAKPRLVQLYNVGEEFRKPFFSLAGLMIPASIGIGVGVCLAVPRLLTHLGKQQYEQQQALFALLACTNIGWCVSGLFDIALVAYHKDLSILVSHVAGVAVSVTANVLLVPLYGTNGAGVASAVAALVVAVSKASIGLRAIAHTGVGRDQAAIMRDKSRP